MDVICDVDGTIADPSHRRYLVQNQHGEGAKFKPDWPRFHDLAIHDTPIVPVIEVVRALWGDGMRVIITTGRPDSHKAMLETWLDAWGVHYTALYMRRAGDTRPDEEVKAEMLERMMRDGYMPRLAIDDRRKVVDLWRAKGLICLQAAPGDF